MSKQLIKIPCTAQAAAEMRAMIDLCQFRAVQIYCAAPDEEVERVAVVGLDYDLAEVAAYFWSATDATYDQFVSFVNAGAFYEMRPTEIVLASPEKWVHCIQLPPFFIVKFKE